MIEVIYDKDKEKDKQESNEKNEHEVSVNLRLPKNIRQIGSNRKRENYLRISDRSDRRMDISASIWKIMLLHI